MLWWHSWSCSWSQVCLFQIVLIHFLHMHSVQKNSFFFFFAHAQCPMRMHIQHKSSLCKLCLWILHLYTNGSCSLCSNHSSLHLYALMFSLDSILCMNNGSIFMQNESVYRIRELRWDVMLLSAASNCTLMRKKRNFSG